MLKNDEGRILDDESGGRGDKMKDESPRIAGITRRFWAHEFYVSRESMGSFKSHAKFAEIAEGTSFAVLPFGTSRNVHLSQGDEHRRCGGGM